jgi:hypothetical protein
MRDRKTSFCNRAEYNFNILMRNSMTILIKKQNHRWLEEIINIINDPIPRRLEDHSRLSQTIKNKIRRVDDAVDQCTFRGYEKIAPLAQFWTTFKTEIVPKSFLITMVSNMVIGGSANVDRNLLAFYYLRLMTIFEIIFDPTASDIWTNNKQDFDILVSLIEYLQNNIQKARGDATIRAVDNCPYTLEPHHNPEFYQLIEHKTASVVHSESNSLVLLSAEGQRELMLRNEDLTRQLAETTQALEETTRQCETRGATIDQLTNALEKVQPALEQAKALFKQEQAARVRAEIALKKANELVASLVDNASSGDDQSPLRAHGQFAPRA